MTPEQFAYWLQGFTELTGDLQAPSPAQWQAIKDHLQTVFVKVTPTVGAPRVDGPFTTQEDRPGKRLADLIRQLQQETVCRPIVPLGPLSQPLITC